MTAAKRFPDSNGLFRQVFDGNKNLFDNVDKRLVKKGFGKLF